MKHVDIAELVNHFESSADQLLAGATVEHIHDCDKCGEMYRKLGSLFATFAERLEEVPQATTARILNIYQRRVQQVSDQIPDATRFLVFDDWTMALNERHRGSDRRHLLFRIQKTDIDLRLQFADDECIVSGQLFPSFPDIRITLEGGGAVIETVTSDLSEFVLLPVPLGIYDLRVFTGDEPIILNSLTLTR